jgi:phage replication O-like protein O
VAAPQLEDGFTRIAHEILEALSKVNLSPYESRIMWCILRKTYGHHKKTDRIALSQISEATGLDRGNASRALRSLKKRNIIASEGHQIGLQKDHEKWRAVSRETRGVSSETQCLWRPHNGVSGDLKSVVGRDTTKYIKIKDSVKGKPPRSNGSDPRVREFFGYWQGEYRKRVGEPYVPSWEKEGTQIKRVLGSHDLPRLKTLVSAFLDSSDPWIQQHGGYTIGVFVSQINKLVSTSRSAVLQPRKVMPL